MWLKVVDGVVVYAAYFVHVQVDCQNINAMSKLAPYQVEVDGVVVYSEDDLQKLEAVLQGLGLPYKIEKLSYNPTYTVKAQGVKYASRSEAIEHILNDKEPGSLIIETLRRELKAKDLAINQLESALQSLKSSLKAKNVL